jgi:RNA polymerase sigma-70 factor (ECF subfamily)
LKQPSLLPGIKTDDEKVFAQSISLSVAFPVPPNSFAFKALSAIACAPRPVGQVMTNSKQFEVFMKNYQNLVFTTAMRLLANQAEAEDISQEVFLKAYRRFAELSESPTAGGWLRTVTTNMCLNHLSRYRARWSFFSDLFHKGPDDEEHEMEFQAPENIDDELACSDRHELVEQALQTLPPAQRVPLVLFHIEGLKYEEIAAKLKVSLGKVKTDIHRAREALRKNVRMQRAQEIH